MLKIECPYCGERDEIEFHYGGEAHRARPENPGKLSDEQWADYLFMRSNKKGLKRERWNHSHGCRRWFNVVRDTTDHTVIGSYGMGEQPTLADLKKRKTGGSSK
ncbi:sarcosine oxidase subunit delta [Cohaesibacter sp. ES.047]|uniref:sarcosine oxidase subunit delta n=1 Tax=Cohaesibacter sp. ES.047 TaxID=1798205 RepID=UPI000BB9819F|nr:sarcosine oxidase subunit delta [Cohaesibacter sp. ES.047]SNY93541.1 sarcosine oxidase subunit delta [Cohaesibacter sp. ES.047]